LRGNTAITRRNRTQHYRCSRAAYLSPRLAAGRPRLPGYLPVLQR
jgi:hypothetical protein